MIQKPIVFISWVLLFIGTNVFFHFGATNPASRVASIVAMAEDQTFHINSYQHWTIDWGKSENGDVYSNKAPGPMFLGSLLYYPIIYFTSIPSLKSISTAENAWIYIEKFQFYLSFITQVLFLSIVVFFIYRYLQELKVSYSALNFTIISILFGNTASLLMSSYFGHGMAAIFMLLTTLSILKKKWTHTGLFLGMTVLSEYTAALTVIPFILAILFFEKDIKKISKMVLIGSIFPAALWSWYHLVSFGSIFKIANMIVNPIFAAPTNEKRFLGFFNFNFDFNIFYEIFLGDSRGILFTQPWILISLPLLFYIIAYKKLSAYRAISTTLLGTFLILVLTNVSFNGWHGGSTIGPRYLSYLFPSIAFLTGIFLDKTARAVQIAIWPSLFVSIIFYILVTSTTILLPEYQPLWPTLLKILFSTGTEVAKTKAILFSIMFFQISIIVILLSRTTGSLKDRHIHRPQDNGNTTA